MSIIDNQEKYRMCFLSKNNNVECFDYCNNIDNIDSLELIQKHLRSMNDIYYTTIIPCSNILPTLFDKYRCNIIAINKFKNYDKFLENNGK